MPSLAAASYMCRNGAKNARDKNKPGRCPITDKEKTVAVKKNANTTATTEPAKDAAVVETTGGTVELTVTPKLEGNANAAEASVQDASPPEETQESTSAARKLTSEEEEEISLYMAEKLQEAAASPAEFLDFVRAVVAVVMGNAGMIIRDDGTERPITGEDLLAISIKGQSVVVVTRDGQKHTIKADVNNEA